MKPSTKLYESILIYKQEIMCYLFSNKIGGVRCRDQKYLACYSDIRGPQLVKAIYSTKLY